MFCKYVHVSSRVATGSKSTPRLGSITRGPSKRSGEVNDSGTKIGGYRCPEAEGELLEEHAPRGGNLSPYCPAVSSHPVFFQVIEAGS